MPPSARGYKYVGVFIDHLNKLVEVYSLKDQTAMAIAKAFPDHGVPKLLSDRGTNFV